MPASPIVRRSLGVLVVIAVVAALKAAQVVLLPLAFALFLTLLLWPLQAKLAESMPRGAAFGLTFLAFLLGLGAFGGAVYFGVSEVADGASAYSEQWEQLRDRLPEPLQPSDGSADDGSSAPDGVAERLLASAWSIAGAFVLTIAFLALALLEVRPFREKVAERFPGSTAHLASESADEIAGKVLSYVGTRVLTSGLTGVLSYGLALAVGLDFAFVWGLLSFLLNFIPTLGSVVSIVPPTLFAVFQFGMGWQVGAVLGGLVVIQLVLGSFVDPKLQGRNLKLSPLVVLFSIAFWGWVWGIGGALIGVPLTVSLVIICDHFADTRWVADLLTSRDEDRSRASADA
jgi:predicted PurR-regulated permease PerM